MNDRVRAIGFATVATRQSPSLFHVSALRASVNYREENDHA
jgi:hypothetical protein